MRFELKLSRQHLSETRLMHFSSRTLEVPLRQAVLVAFDCETDAFQLGENALIERATPLVSASFEKASENGWGPWTVTMLRDVWHFDTPVPLVLPNGSPAERALALQLDAFPQLFGEDAFSPYRVLHHWFCVIGNGLSWNDEGCLEGASLSEEILKKERLDQHRKKPTPEECRESALREWDRLPLMTSPVPLYPVSSRYCKIFTIPDNVEDSYLSAAVQLLVYLLARPVWENNAYGPGDLVGAKDPVARQKVWASDDWRHIALADGAKYRALLELAYSDLVLGVHANRIREMGFRDNFYPLDYRLPPRARKFVQTAPLPHG